MSDSYDIAEYASNEEAYPVSLEQNNDIIGEVQDGEKDGGCYHFVSLPLYALSLHLSFRMVGRHHFGQQGAAILQARQNRI